MQKIHSSPRGCNAPAQINSKFRSIGAVPLGDNAQLAVQIGTTDGRRVLNFRNELRGHGGMNPAGGGALVGADQIDALIAILAAARAAS